MFIVFYFHLQSDGTQPGLSQTLLVSSQNEIVIKYFGLFRITKILTIVPYATNS